MAISEDTVRSAEYWLDHLRNTVEFWAAVQTMSCEPHRAFVEVGPGATLCGFLRKCPKLNESSAIVACDNTAGQSQDCDRSIRDLDRALSAQDAAYRNVR